MKRESAEISGGQIIVHGTIEVVPGSTDVTISNVTVIPPE